jgi:hypothetical protein
MQSRQRSALPIKTYGTKRGSATASGKRVQFARCWRNIIKLGKHNVTRQPCHDAVKHHIAPWQHSAVDKRQRATRAAPETRVVKVDIGCVQSTSAEDLAG